MHIRRGRNRRRLAGAGARCHHIGDKPSALLFVQSGLLLNRLQHKCVQGDLSALLAAATTRRLRSAAILSVVATVLVIIAPSLVLLK